MESSDIRSLLEPGERLIWTGRPAPAPLISRQGCASTAFALFFTLFSLFWMAMAFLLSGGDGYFWMFGIPFFLAGIFMLIVLPVMNLKGRKATTYAVTDRRVLIRRGGALTTRQITFETPISLIQVGQGAGSITFGEQIWNPEYSGEKAGQTVLEGVPDAAGVFKQIEQHFARARATAEADR